MIDILIILIVKIRLDIVFAIVVVAWFAQNPSHAYTKGITTIFCYLKKLINYDIIYDREKKLFIKRYLDSN